MILNKCSYKSPTEYISNDYAKYFKLRIPAGKEIKQLTNLEKRTTSDLELLRKKKKLLIRLLTIM